MDPAGAAAPRGRVGRGEMALMLVLALLGRLPLTMTNLALVLLARHEGLSYAATGVVAGTLTVSTGGAAPFIGRLADRLGHARVLVATAAGCSVALGVMGAIPGRLGVVGMTALAVVGGALTPPVATVYRAALPRLVPPDALRTLYGLEAACQEAVFVVGPMMIVALIAATSAPLGMLVCAALTGVVTLAFAAMMARHSTPSRAGGRTGAVLRDRRLRAVLVTYALLGGTFGGIEIAAIAGLEAVGEKSRAGVVLGVWAAGSLVGGLMVTRLWHAPALRRLTLLLPVMVLAGVPLVLTASAGPVWMGVALTVEGVAIAPTIAAVYELIQQIAPPHALTEAFSWSIGSVVCGSALGTVVAGWLASHAGVTAAFATASAFPLLSTLWLRAVGGRGRTRRAAA